MVTMNTIFVQEKIKYTGKELSPHWIYKKFNRMGDSICAFLGEVEVKLTEMVDIEDVIDNSPIYSKEMLNFIVEIFEIPLTQAVYIQRLLITTIKEELENRGFFIKRDGDDLFFEDGKLTVSIATKSITSTLIHTGINIKSEGAPIKVSALEDMGISDIENFAKIIMEKFNNEIEDIKLATTKVRGVF